MKTIDYLRKYFPVVTIFALLIASSMGAIAENRHKENKENKGHERNEYRHSDRNNERTASSEWHNRNENRNMRNEYHPEYARRNDHGQPNYFYHPKYGRVYNHFENNPIVFRNQFGDYYYSGNNFYRYRDGIGYCLSEPPRNQYYRNLPVDCMRVYVNGQVFYRNGDLFFELSPRGYVLVPSPFEIRLSARF